MNKGALQIALLIMIISFLHIARAQTGYIISGKITEAVNGRPSQNAIVHLKGSGASILSKMDGSFKMFTDNWYDSLLITNVGFEAFAIDLHKGRTTNLTATMKNKSDSSKAVVIGFSKVSGKSLMEKVIEQKANNNPSRFRCYSYRRYTRNELDIDRVDFDNNKGNGLKSLVLNTYIGLESSAIEEEVLRLSRAYTNVLKFCYD